MSDTDRPLRHEDLPGIPWEQRMHLLHQDRARRTAIAEQAARDAAEQARLDAIGPVPPPLRDGVCGHGITYGANNLGPGIAWAGGVDWCQCCQSHFPYLASTWVAIDNRLGVVSHGHSGYTPGRCDDCQRPPRLQATR